MKCSFCAYEFDEISSRHSCRGCFKLGGCSMIRCPRCGYETPPTPEWIKRLNRMFGKEKK